MAGKIELVAPLDGVVTIEPEDTASNFTVTIPAVTAELLNNSSGILNIGSGQVYKAANGNVGIGTSSPGGLGEKLTISTDGLGNSVLSSTAFSGSIWKSSTTTVLGRYIAAEADAMTFGRFGTGEDMRLDASGNLLVGTTSVLGGGTTPGFSYNSSLKALNLSRSGNACLALQRSASDGAIAVFLRDTAVVGSISVTTTATAYNTSSDYRLKEDAQPVLNPIDRLMQLKPINFAWKVDGSRTDGFLAHEAQAVVPEAVTGTKDAVDKDGKPEYQGIDQSKLVPLLTAALQELKAELDTVKAELNTLKGN